MPVNPWKNMKVHRIYTYIEHGLYPELLELFFNKALEHGCREVVDPFIGSGVVAVEAQRRDLNVIGIDANPWSLIVTKAKTRKPNYEKVVKAINEVLYCKDQEEVLIPSERLEQYHEKSILIRLGRLRAIIEDAEGEEKPLLLTVFGKIVDEYSLLKRSPAPKFVDREQNLNKMNMDPFERFRSALSQAINDLKEHEFGGLVELIWSDSSIWLPRRICCLITSPPFTNNVDYVRHSQLQLLWSGLARNSNDLGYLRSLQLPACIAAARSWKQEIEHEEVNKYVREINGKKAKGYKKFVKQYFYYMRKHFQLLYDRLEWEAWYTIGDSILGGAYIPTHKLLKRIAEEIGFKAEVKILDQRRHGSKVLGLYLLRLIVKH